MCECSTKTKGIGGSGSVIVVVRSQCMIAFDGLHKYCKWTRSLAIIRRKKKIKTNKEHKRVKRNGGKQTSDLAIEWIFFFVFRFRTNFALAERTVWHRQRNETNRKQHACPATCTWKHHEQQKSSILITVFFSSGVSFLPSPKKCSKQSDNCVECAPLRQVFQ